MYALGECLSKHLTLANIQLLWRPKVKKDHDYCGEGVAVTMCVL